MNSAMSGSGPRENGPENESYGRLEQDTALAVARILYVLEMADIVAEQAVANTRRRKANLHHRWLSTREHARRFGVDVEEIDRLKGWAPPARRSWM